MAKTSERWLTEMLMKRYFLVIFILSSGAHAQGSAFIITWDAVEQREDETYIDDDEPIAYRVYEVTTGSVICETDTLECRIPAQRGQCGTAYVTAILVESGAESVPSNSVSGCIGDGDGDDPVIELDLSPPVAPEAEMTTTESEGNGQGGGRPWWQR